MRSSGSVRRWLTFALSASALVVGLVVLTAQATESDIPSLPERNEDSTASSAATTNQDGSPVVDRLDTWAETKLKTKLSTPKGGGKGK
jgi:hypothetical protein